MHARFRKRIARRASFLAAAISALLMVLNSADADWYPVGALNFSGGAVSDVSLEIDAGELYVAYRLSSNGNVVVKHYTGGSWQTVGTAGFTPGSATSISLAIGDGEPYVAFKDGANGNKASVMRYTAGSWQVVGSAGFTPDVADDISLAYHAGEPYVLFRDNANWSELSVMRYTGGSWQNVGVAGFTPTSGFSGQIVFYAGEPYVAYLGTGIGYANVMRYTGGSWQSVGATDFAAFVDDLSLAFVNGEPVIAFSAGGHDRATAMRYTSGSWQVVGVADFTLGSVNFISMVDNEGIPYIAFQDGANSYRLGVMRYLGGSWQNVESSFDISATYYHQISAYNGRPYVAYGTVNGLNVYVFAEPPSVTTESVANITTTTAQINGDVTDDGAVTVTERGICWHTLSPPVISDHAVPAGSGVGGFTSALTGLSPGTTYYARAYAINNQGVSYGVEETFRTTTTPTVTTTTASNIAATSAQFGGTVTDDGGLTVTQRGICWSTSSTPTTSDQTVTSGSGIGSYLATLTGLTPNTQYYVRAYAINSVGTSYGVKMTLTTSTNTPTVATLDAVNITPSSADIGGEVTADGGAEVTARGICYATTSPPTTADSTVSSGSGLGDYRATLSTLSPETTYYARAFATNRVGTGYGDTVSFTTHPAPIPKAPQLSVSIRLSRGADDESPNPNQSVANIAVGDQISVLVTVQNSGTAAANGVMTQIPIPVGLQFIAAYRIAADAAQNVPLEAAVIDNMVVLQLDVVDMNEAIDVEVRFEVLTAGEMTFAATISSDEQPDSITTQADDDVAVDDTYVPVDDPYVEVNTTETPLALPCGFLGFTSLLALVGLVGITRRFGR